MKEEEETLLSCHSCDNEIPDDEIIEVDNQFYCIDCVFECDSCNNYTTENSGDTEITLCESCRSDCYFVCDHCGELSHNDNYAGNGLCESCYCYPEEEEGFCSEYVNESDFKPSPVFYGEEGLKFGIELEIDKPYQERELYQDFVEKLSSTGKDRIYLKKDGSLSDAGIEIVSHPMDINEHRKYDWKEILDISKSCGYKSHDTSNCGLHIHINKNFLTPSEQIRLGIFVAMNKDRIEKIARRKEERYAKFKNVSGNLKDANKNDASRYEAINWNNPETIEFRFFRGTLKYSTFMAAIEFIHSIVNFVKQTSVTKIIKHTAFKSYLEHLRKSKDYTILEAYLKEREVS